MEVVNNIIFLFSHDNIQTTNCRERKGKKEKEKRKRKKILADPTKTIYMIYILLFLFSVLTWLMLLSQCQNIDSRVHNSSRPITASGIVFLSKHIAEATFAFTAKKYRLS